MRFGVTIPNNWGIADPRQVLAMGPLAPTYEKPFSAYGEYRPWRTGLAGNVERTFAMVS